MKIYKLINFTRYFINIIVIAAFILGTTGSSLASASMDQPATLDRWQDTTALKPNLIGGEPLMRTAGEDISAAAETATVRADIPLSTAQGSAETEVPILLEPEDGVQETDQNRGILGAAENLLERKIDNRLNSQRHGILPGGYPHQTLGGLRLIVRQRPGKSQGFSKITAEIVIWHLLRRDNT